MHPTWGWIVAIYLFLGGLAAGAFLVAAVLELTGKRDRSDFSPITLAGAVATGPILIVGVLLLVLDLGAGLREPWRIPLMWIHLSSVMTWGVWILSLFIPVSLIYGFLEVIDQYPEAWRRVTSRRWARWLVSLQGPALRRAKRILAILGSVLAVLTALYTGVLLSAVGPAVPLWSTPILPFVPISVLPLLFLVSAIATGVALTVDVAATLYTADIGHRIKGLSLIHLALVLLEALLLGLLLVGALVSGGSAAQAVEIMLTGPYSVVFWVFFVLPAFVFPFILNSYELARGRHSASVGAAVGVGVLVAGLFLRYLILANGIPVAL